MIGLDGVSAQALSDTIGAIHDCALDPQRWPDTCRATGLGPSFGTGAVDQPPSTTVEMHFIADAAGSRIQSIHNQRSRHARTSRYRGRRSCPVVGAVGAKLIVFFTAPAAEADSLSIESVRVDVSQIHQNAKNLPLQKFHDMSVVFPDRE